MTEDEAKKLRREFWEIRAKMEGANAEFKALAEEAEAIRQSPMAADERREALAGINRRKRAVWLVHDVKRLNERQREVVRLLPRADGTNHSAKVAYVGDRPADL